MLTDATIVEHDVTRFLFLVLSHASKFVTWNQTKQIGKGYKRILHEAKCGVVQSSGKVVDMAEGQRKNLCHMQCAYTKGTGLDCCRARLYTYAPPVPTVDRASRVTCGGMNAYVLCSARAQRCSMRITYIKHFDVPFFACVLFLPLYILAASRESFVKSTHVLAFVSVESAAPLQMQYDALMRDEEVVGNGMRVAFVCTRCGSKGVVHSAQVGHHLRVAGQEDVKAGNIHAITAVWRNFDINGYELFHVCQCMPNTMAYWSWISPRIHQDALWALWTRLHLWI